MGPKLKQPFDSPLVDSFLASYPPVPYRIRFLDHCVRYFPRRFFKFLSPHNQDKFVSHALFFSRPLTSADRYPETSPCVVGVADKGIVQRLIDHPEGFRADMYWTRFNRGDTCYYLLHDGEIKCYQWVNSSFCSIYCGHESEVIFHHLREHQAYTYDFYTYSDFRGQGYGKILKHHVWADLHNRKVVRCYSGIHPDNFVSLKIHLAGGFKLECPYYLYRVMSWTLAVRGTQKQTLAIANWLDSLTLESSPQPDQQSA